MIILNTISLESEAEELPEVTLQDTDIFLLLKMKKCFVQSCNFNLLKT